MKWRSFLTFLFTERLGYRRPPVVTPQDAVMRTVQERRFLELAREVGLVDVELMTQYPPESPR